MQLWVKVVPRSKRFAIEIKDGNVILHATEEPERNKVNLEIIKRLSRSLGRSVRLISGASSRKKLLEIDGDEAEVMHELAVQ